MPKRSPVRISKHLARLTAGLVLTSLTLPLAHMQNGAVHLGIQTATAANGRAGSQRANSKIIILLIASSREENPTKALELLAQAREELKKEGLAADDNARILAMIEDLEAKARAKIERQKPANTSALSTASGLPVIADLGNIGTADDRNGTGLTTDEVEKALETHPEVRDTLWEIGRGRLSRDAQNLDAIIQDKTGKTPAQLDAQDAANLAEAYKPGVFLELLRKANIVNTDISKANLQLKQEYDGIALNVIADQLTRDAIKFSVPAGFLQGTLADVGFGGKFLGLSGEAIATFAINTNLALRISDLYGIEMSDSEKEIVLLLIFTAAKVSSRVGPATTKGMIATLGEKLGGLKYEGKAGALVAALQKVFNVPAIAAIAAPAINGSALVTTGEAAKAEVDAKTEAKAAPTVAGTTAATSPKKLAVIKSIAGRINFAMWLKSGLYAARSGAETFAVGQAATWLFSGMHQTKRKIHNENFRRFLMSPAGEGFTKLLVLAMNDGVPSTKVNGSASPETKAKADFIVNIAKSARVCTDEDLASLAKGAKATSTASYACQANPSTARFTRLKNEVLTFNEIPQDYVADLRIVSREHRLRMADLVLQMQFLDGDRTPSETDFFRTVVAKTLGVDSREDLEYFDRLHAFIQESGGLVRSNATPTGFMIRTDAKAHSYDMEQGYSPLSAPEPPPGERYLGTSTTVKSTTSTTVAPAPATSTTTTTTIEKK